MKMTYFVRVEKPHLQMFHVEMVIEEITESEITLTLPAWTPGSYLIRDFSKNVRKFAAYGKDGEPLENKKKDKLSWKVSTGGRTELRISYSVYADELSVRTSHMDASHAFILGTSLFMYMEGYKDQTVEVDLHLPEGWHATTALDKIGNDRYRATNYDILVDSPIEAGTHEDYSFTIDGKEHVIALYGLKGINFERQVADMKKIAETAIKVFEHVPFKRYVFIIHAYPGAQGGGLEHSNSCVISTDIYNAIPGEKYDRFLSVVSHEYFHAWNVKRIRPVELGPFNYREENYTTLLWFSEGFTEYFGNLILYRSGLIDRKRYFELISDMIHDIESLPGALETSLADSSFDTWIRLYKPSPDDLNSYISYYLKGNAAGLLLNINMIASTSGSVTIDSLMKALYDRFRRDGKGITEKDIINVANDLTSADFRDFFQKYIRGTDKVDFDSELSKVGLSITRKSTWNKSGSDLSTTGMLIKKENGAFRVYSVLRGWPSYESGINAGDEIVAVNGKRFTDANTKAPGKNSWLLYDALIVNPGSLVDVILFRRNSLLSVSIKTTSPPNDSYEMQEDKKPSPEAAKYLDILLAK